MEVHLLNDAAFRAVARSWGAMGNPLERDRPGWGKTLRRHLLGQRNTALRDRLRHIGHLLTGSAMAMALSLASLALVARALGPASYGILALTISFTQAIERIISFQSWQPLIRFGAELDATADQEDLKSLLKFGLLLDMAASLAAWLIANLLLVAGHSIFGWNDEALRIVQLYSVVLLFGLSGMPTATLRLAGRFRAIAYGQVFSAAVRLAALAVTYMAGGGLFSFALVWAATQILSALVMLIVAFHALHHQGVRGLLSARLAGITERFSGLWRFTWSANLSLTIWTSPQQMDTLIVGALASPTEAGFYHVAKRISRAALQAASQVQAVVYPELARLWGRDAIAEFRRAIRQMEWMLAIAGVCSVIAAALIAYPAIRLTMGAAFVPAAPLLIAQMVAVAMTISGTVTRSALLAMGYQQQVLWIVMASTLVFGVVVTTLVPAMGAMGGNIAHIALATTWLAGMMFTFKRALHDAANLKSSVSSTDA